MHDLVDFVSEEAEGAGRAAAKRALGQTQSAENYVAVEPGALVNYVVPQRIDLAALDEKTPFFLRVANVFQNKKLVVRRGDDVIKEIKRLRVAPAEMERVELDRETLLADQNGKITISLED